MAEVFRSRCYGVRLVSAAPIPGLESLDRSHETSLRIDLGGAPDWTEAPDWAELPAEEPAKIELDADRTLLRYADGTRFYLDFDQSRIWARWPEPLTLEDTATYLLGPVLGHYLRRRGCLCLHASSAMIDGHCVAFVGAAGTGKSTLAAALALKGDGILSEDVTCLTAAPCGFEVQPGYPRIRLWNDAAALIGVPAETLPLLTPNWDKRFLPLNGKECAFHDHAERLDAIFLLAPRREMQAAAAISDLDGQRILSGLVANTYGNLLLGRKQRQEEFAALGELARAVPVRSLALNADGSRLFEACDWIRALALS